MTLEIYPAQFLSPREHSLLLKSSRALRHQDSLKIPRVLDKFEDRLSTPLTVTMHRDIGVTQCYRSTMPSKSKCKHCYQRERAKDPLARAIDIKRRCSNPTNGCVMCNVYVCSSCWPLHVEEVRRQRLEKERRHAGKAPKTHNNVQSGSVVMESLFATNGANWREFLDTVWGKKPRHFTYDAEVRASISSISSSSSPMSIASSSSSSSTSSNRQLKLIPAVLGGDGCWREVSMVVFPWKETIRQGWHILLTLMGDKDAVERSMTEVWLIQDFEQKTREQILEFCGDDLYAAYLSGCSISWKNCDLISPHIAAICQDLQGQQDRNDKNEKGGAFPKNFSSAYLTPPHHSEVNPPCSNNQNVLIFQLVGRKYWKIACNATEIATGASGQQHGITETSSQVLIEPLLFDGYLYPGDVLYIPKGMSYQTQSQSMINTNLKTTGMDDETKDESESEPSISFHVTVSLAAPNALAAGSKLGETVNQSSPIIPHNTTSINDNTSIAIAAEASLEDPTNAFNDEYHRLLTRKRSELIDHAKRTLPDGKRTSWSRMAMAPSPVASSAPYGKDIGELVDQMRRLVGGTAAAAVSFRSEIRLSTSAERQHAQELLFQGFAVGKKSGLYTRIRGEIVDVVEAIEMKVRERSSSPSSPSELSSASYAWHCRVVDLRDLVKKDFPKSQISLFCDLTLLSFVKRRVELGDFAVVPSAPKSLPFEKPIKTG